MATNYATAQDQAVVGQRAFLTQAGQGLTVKDIINDILLLWGIQYGSLAPEYQMKRAIHDMNGALQMIWSLAKDASYFSRTTLTLTFAAGVASYILPGTVLTILGPCRFAASGIPLRPITSRPQFDSFAPIFLGVPAFQRPQGNPIAYWIEKLNIDLPNNVQNIVHLVPTPASAVSLLLDVSNQAPRYEWSDYLAATPVQFPQLYADSVLIPFCRYRAMTSFRLIRPDITPSLVADYQNALKLIGAIDPSQKEVEFSERASDRAAA